MAKWKEFPRSWKMSERERRVIVDGINIIIGAVLGFVLAGAEGLPVYDFAALLLISVCVVILILFLESSEYTLFCAGLTAAAILAFPFVTEDFLNLANVPKLQPTLAIWAAMILAAQLLPKQHIHTQEQSN